jgi:hypothetical protein
MSEKSNCPKCNAVILWVKTQNGLNMPLDMASSERRFVIDPSDGMLAKQRNTYDTHLNQCAKGFGKNET